jgi:predicted HAD superfamily phosphohydrolase
VFSRVKKLFIILLGFAAGNVHADLIDGEELRDPTRPLFVRAQETSSGEVLSMIRNVVPASYDLSFVRASSSSPIAVINSERVTVGDVIGGATVVAIERSSVTLSVNGEERVITLYDQSIKSPVTQ